MPSYCARWVRADVVSIFNLSRELSRGRLSLRPNGRGRFLTVTETDCFCGFRGKELVGKGFRVAELEAELALEVILEGGMTTRGRDLLCVGREEVEVRRRRRKRKYASERPASTTKKERRKSRAMMEPVDRPRFSGTCVGEDVTIGSEARSAISSFD